MEKFIIRAYNKSELALRYFPTTADPHVAVNHLMAWIDRCRTLAEAPPSPRRHHFPWVSVGEM